MGGEEPAPTTREFVEDFNDNLMKAAEEEAAQQMEETGETSAPISVVAVAAVTDLTERAGNGTSSTAFGLH